MSSRGSGAQIKSALNKIAINLCKQNPRKMSNNRKRNRTSWETAFLEQLLLGNKSGLFHVEKPGDVAHESKPRELQATDYERLPRRCITSTQEKSSREHGVRRATGVTFLV